MIPRPRVTKEAVEIGRIVARFAGDDRNFIKYGDTYPAKKQTHLIMDSKLMWRAVVTEGFEDGILPTFTKMWCQEVMTEVGKLKNWWGLKGTPRNDWRRDLASRFRSQGRHIQLGQKRKSKWVMEVLVDKPLADIAEEDADNMGETDDDHGLDDIAEEDADNVGDDSGNESEETLELQVAKEVELEDENEGSDSESQSIAKFMQEHAGDGAADATPPTPVTGNAETDGARRRRRTKSSGPTETWIFRGWDSEMEKAFRATESGVMEWTDDVLVKDDDQDSEPLTVKWGDGTTGTIEDITIGEWRLLMKVQGDAKGPNKTAQVYFEGTLDKEKVVVKDRTDRFPLISMYLGKSQLLQIRKSALTDTELVKSIMVDLATRLCAKEISRTNLKKLRDEILEGHIKTDAKRKREEVKQEKERCKEQEREANHAKTEINTKPKTEAKTEIKTEPKTEPKPANTPTLELRIVSPATDEKKPKPKPQPKSKSKPTWKANEEVPIELGTIPLFHAFSMMDLDD